MTVLADHPEPHPGRLGPRAAARSAPTRCASSPASSSPCWLTEKRWVARGGAPGDVAGHRRVGGAVRHRRRPALPRDHQPAAPTSARAATRCGAFAIWEGGLGIWGAIALGGVGAWIACRRRGIRCRPSPTRWPPGSLVAQAIGRLGNWFNRSSSAARPTCRGALEIYEWDGGRRRPSAPTDQPIVLGYVPPHVPLRAAVEPGRRRRSWSGPTAGSGSATAGRSRCTWPATAPAGCGSSCCASTRPSTSSGVRLNVFTSVVVGPAAPWPTSSASAAGPARSSTAARRGAARRADAAADPGRRPAADADATAVRR